MRARAAVHEAAHVVIALLVGFRVANAWVRPTYRSGGFQAQTQLDGSWRASEPRARLAVWLAGALAEARHAGLDVLDVLREGCEDEDSDLRRAQREAHRLTRSGAFNSTDHALFTAEGHAKRLLAGHWQFVLHAAGQLYTAGRID